jgi:hypothetical protein
MMLISQLELLVSFADEKKRLVVSRARNELWLNDRPSEENNLIRLKETKRNHVVIDLNVWYIKFN